MTYIVSTFPLHRLYTRGAQQGEYLDQNESREGRGC
jgi:hypothetical protein